MFLNKTEKNKVILTQRECNQHKLKQSEESLNDSLLGGFGDHSIFENDIFIFLHLLLDGFELFPESTAVAELGSKSVNFGFLANNVPVFNGLLFE